MKTSIYVNTFKIDYGQWETMSFKAPTFQAKIIKTIDKQGIISLISPIKMAL